MLFRVDLASSEPLAEQIAAQVRGGLLRGELAPGERLPSARELAAVLEVNLHTVLRAYGQLRDEQLVDLRRGRGAVVRGDADAGRLRLVELARQFTREARRQGLRDEEVLAILKEAQA
ncbi:GntR family transcriptional regulator [Kineosporia rhizophila]|uniref:GntR family transcriptional regulator n=1 Tax=Kineosporia TaxID=49184 RepID=UPI001E3ACAFF|nr:MULTISPECIES: GntR family transcriptional regulator [Kineosporia]MCE0537904.1 GntR family transcriptional regulator [Kineosporia rhizophila]GLY15895.1 GntR family transcriptional regulator [Kineosporia sp. NBRC 101677]